MKKKNFIYLIIPIFILLIGSLFFNLQNNDASARSRLIFESGDSYQVGDENIHVANVYIDVSEDESINDIAITYNLNNALVYKIEVADGFYFTGFTNTTGTGASNVSWEMNEDANTYNGVYNSSSDSIQTSWNVDLEGNGTGTYRHGETYESLDITNYNTATNTSILNGSAESLSNYTHGLVMNQTGITSFGASMYNDDIAKSNGLVEVISQTNITNREKLLLLKLHYISTGDNCDVAFGLSKTELNTTDNVSITKRAIASIGATSALTSVEVGGEFYYEIKVSNPSILPTEQLTIIDTIPDDFEIVNAGGGTLNGNTITWTKDYLSSNETVTYNVLVKTLQKENRVSRNITNIVRVAASGIIKEASTNINILEPHLTISKTASKAEVYPKEEFSYVVTVTNDGTLIARNVTLTDLISDNFNVLSVTTSSGENLSNNNNFSANIGDIGVSGSKTITFRVKVKDDAELGNVNNIATVAGDSISEISSSARVKIVDSKLTIQKNVDKTRVGIQEEFTYNIVIKNNGNIASKALTITDEIPNNLEIIRANDGIISGNNVTWNLDSLAIGATRTYTIKARSITGLTAGTKIKNTALLHEDGMEDKTSEVEVELIDSNIKLSKTASKNELKPGETFNYTIEVENTGTSESKDIVIKDVIDSGLDIVSAIDANINGSTVTWSISSLAINQKKTFNIAVKVKNDVVDNTKINNVVILKEGDKDEIKASDEVVVRKPIISITKEALNATLTNNITTIKPNTEFNYQITITNSGSIASERIILQDTLNDLLTIVDSNDGTINNKTITWNIDSIPSGGTITKTIKVKVSSSATNGTAINNIAIATHGDDEYSASVPITVVDSELYIVKTVSKSEVLPGEEVTYTIKIENTGDAAAPDVVVTDVLPKNMQLVTVVYNNAEVTYTTDNGAYKFVFANVDAKTSKTIQIHARVNTDVKIGDVLKNTATLKYGEKIQESSANVTIIDSDINVTKTSSKAKVVNGEEFVYTIVVSNNGTYKAEDIVVVDTYDKNLQIIDCDRCKVEDNKITWKIESLGANKSISYKVKAKIQNQEIGYIIKNKVVATELDKETKEAEVNVEVVDYVLEISKSVNYSKVNPGQDFKYTIKVKNTSDIAVSNLIVSDKIDDALNIVDAKGSTTKDNTATWNISILPQEEKTLEITVSVPKNTKLGTISNVAILTDRGKDKSSNKVDVVITDEVLSPRTGSFVNYVALGIIGASAIYLITITNRKQKIHKI